jgi:acetoacetate decarboxylase
MPAYYRDTLFQTVFYTTDKDNVAAVLPDILEPADDGMCVAFAVDVPFCTHWGPFKEVGVCAKAVFRDQEAFFLPSLFLNNPDAIVAGREVWGSPKMAAEITVEQHYNELTSTAVRAGVQFLQINSRIVEPAVPEEVPSLFPLYVLKVIPKSGSNEPAIKQLIDSGVPTDVKTHKLFKGPGVVSYRPTVSGDFWKLEPKEYVGAFYQELDYTQDHGSVVYDYLAE